MSSGAVVLMTLVVSIWIVALTVTTMSISIRRLVLLSARVGIWPPLCLCMSMTATLPRTTSSAMSATNTMTKPTTTSTNTLTMGTLTLIVTTMSISICRLFLVSARAGIWPLLWLSILTTRLSTNTPKTTTANLTTTIESLKFLRMTVVTTRTTVTPPTTTTKNLQYMISETQTTTPARVTSTKTTTLMPKTTTRIWVQWLLKLRAAISMMSLKFMAVQWLTSTTTTATATTTVTTVFPTKKVTAMTTMKRVLLKSRFLKMSVKLAVQRLLKLLPQVAVQRLTMTGTTVIPKTRMTAMVGSRLLGLAVL
mmetsp:Transcript_145293/g.464219  ORF Transcript_145293/g.464219 Transcript_145293/m.464219 type:complete len:309 (+) Transcript_145293:475-1401(+)